jgi:hypothetical protein
LRTLVQAVELHCHRLSSRLMVVMATAPQPMQHLRWSAALGDLLVASGPFKEGLQLLTMPALANQEIKALAAWTGSIKLETSSCSELRICHIK